MSIPKKYKILHIITRLDPGGSSTNTIETVSRLDKEKFDAFLISGVTQNVSVNLLESLNREGISFLFIGYLQRDISIWHDLKAFFALYRYIKKEKYDIVHTHSSKAGILGRWAAWLAGTRHIVHTPHGHVFYGYFKNFLTKFFIFIERITSSFTSKIITLTDIEQIEYLERNIARPNQLVTIPSGIDIRMFRSDGKKNKEFLDKWKIPRDHQIIGSVTRLDPIKGNRYLIEAMPRIIQEFPKTTLVLLGDGSEKSYLEYLIENLNISDHVVLCGYQMNVNSWLHLIDIFVLASINEGMGRAILEAMASGLPVIATKTGGIPELIQDGVNGILIPTKNSQMISDAVLKLIRNPNLRQHYGENGLKSVTEKFGIEMMVKNLESLYDNLMKEEK
jgi:glycosyltransferase involved in cell wall biosynthesis